MSIQAVCPSCDASYTLADTQRGKKVRCRKCSNTFVVEEANGDDAPEAAPIKSSKNLRKEGLQASPRAPAKSGPPSAKMTPAAARRDRNLDDEDEEDRPIRKPSVQKKGKSPLPLILMIGGGVLLLLLLGGAAVVAVVVYSVSNTAQNGFNTVANAAQNAQNNFPIQQGDPNNPGFNPGGVPVADSPKDVNEALGWIDNGIQDRKIVAANWLASAQVDDALRSKVAASLERLMATPAAHEAALRGLSTWAGPENVPTLLAEVPRAGGIGSGAGPAIDALVRLKAPEVVPILARELANPFEHEHVADRLANLGKIAEKDVLPYLNSADANARSNADRLLRGYGTSDAKRFDQSLADLSDPEPGKAKQACISVGRARVDEARRAEVSKSLETPLDAKESEVRGAAADALKTWGTKDNVPALVKALDKTDFGFGGSFDSCMEALARLKDERGAEAIARHLTDFGPRRASVIAALADMGPVAEKAVAAYLNHRDPEVASAADKLIKGYGSKADVRFAATLDDLNAREADKRKAACEFLAKQPFDAANQKQVARALDKLLDDPDFWVPNAAAKAEVVWADKDSIPALVKRMDKNQFGQEFQPCLDALAHIKDDKAVFAVLGQLTKHPKEVQVALLQMGPLVETALDDALSDPAASPGDKVFACKALFDLGTKTSFPALQAATMDANPDVKNVATLTLKALKKRTGTP